MMIMFLVGFLISCWMEESRMHYAYFLRTIVVEYCQYLLLHYRLCLINILTGATTLIGDSSNSAPLPHPIVFKQLDGFCIHHAALKTGGAAGPSGLDAAAWCWMCTLFQCFSDDLCEVLAGVAKRWCTVFVDPAWFGCLCCLPIDCIGQVP